MALLAIGDAQECQERQLAPSSIVGGGNGLGSFQALGKTLLPRLLCSLSREGDASRGGLVVGFLPKRREGPSKKMTGTRKYLQYQT